MVVASTKDVRFEIVVGALVPLLGLLVITGFRFGFRNGLVATLLAVLSLLLHEVGHAYAALLTHTRLSALGFCLWGSYIRRERAKGAAELFISAAGPATNLLIIALLWKNSGILGWLAQFNLFLLVANLIPHRGSDGRRMLITLREIMSRSASNRFRADSTPTS